MPIYEYRCQNGHTFEVMQRITEDPVSTCTVCEAPVQRVFHPVAVHFKGSGFYNTDYGTRKRSREKEGAGDGADAKPASNGSGAESKTSDNSGASKDKSSGSSPAASPAPAKNAD